MFSVCVGMSWSKGVVVEWREQTEVSIKPANRHFYYFLLLSAFSSYPVHVHAMCGCSVTTNMFHHAGGMAGLMVCLFAKFNKWWQTWQQRNGLELEFYQVHKWWCCKKRSDEPLVGLVQQPIHDILYTSLYNVTLAIYHVATNFCRTLLSHISRISRHS